MSGARGVLDGVHQALKRGQWRQAEELCRKALPLTAGTPEVYVLLAVALARQGRIDAALASVEQGLGRDAGHAQGRQLRADLLFTTGRFAEAEQDYRAVLAAKAQTPAALYGLAAVCQRQKKLRDAVDAYRRYLRLDPANAHAINDLATALVDLGDFAEGARLYRQALSRAPKLAGARVNLALVEFSPDRLADAVQAVEQGLRDAPDMWLAQVHLALLYRLSGDEAAATRLYGQAAQRSDEAAAIRDSHDYFLAHREGARVHGERLKVLEDAVAASPEQGLVCEFGVYRGTSLQFVAARISGTAHGFDSFEGLPEDWTADDRKGKYTTGGALPQGPDNIALHVGWFNDTLPTFLAEHEGPARLLHIDCDLYSSTQYVFEAMGDRIVEGTVIVFDEYFGYAGWRDHEWRAFQEFVGKRGLSYRYLSFNPFGKQAAVVIG